MSQEYTKLAKGIVYSSIWEEDGDTCKVWITFLALKDANGIVDQNITGIARLTKLPIDVVQRAIDKFLAPDKVWPAQEFEGKRLQKVPHGWLVLNHEKYREFGWSDEKKEYERKRKAAYRLRKAAQNQTTPSSPPPSSPPPTPAEIVPWDAALSWLQDSNKNGSDYTEPELKKAFLYLQTTGWKRKNGTPIIDYRSALELQITSDREYKAAKPVSVFSRKQSTPDHTKGF